ncbi:MAG: DUF2085 domain-containing protein [Thermoflexales bacterium]|nr:DUF2085 domain-containing protein [Thermoflexales bacterium]
MSFHRRILWLVGLLLVLAASSLAPRAWLRALDFVGYAVCHRIPSRSFFVAGEQLPLCARDTGMFSAALLSLTLFASTLRGRPARFPRGAWRVGLGALALAWAADGLNSYVALITGRPLAYPPSNLLRLITGAGMGIVMSTLLVSLFNQAVWARSDPSAPIAGWRDAWLPLTAAGATVGLYLWRPDAIYGPLVMISALGVIVLVGVLVGLIMLVALNRHGRVETARALALPMALGFTLGVLGLRTVAELRLALLGPALPFSAP